MDNKNISFFLINLKSCIDKSKYLKWYENKDKYGIVFDKNSKNLINDLNLYKVMKSNKIESFVKQLNLYKFYRICNKKNSKKTIYVNEKIKKTDSKFDISNIERIKSKKRKKIIKKEYFNNIQKKKKNNNKLPSIIELTNKFLDELLYNDYYNSNVENYLDNYGFFSDSDNDNYSNVYDDDDNDNEIDNNNFELEPLVVPDD